MTQRVIDKLGDIADQLREQAWEAEKLGQLPDETWVADGATVENSNIGTGAYICPGSTVKQDSEVIGGADGVVEIVNSKVSGASLVFGNVQIDNSNVDHSEIQNDISNDQEWTPDLRYQKISFATISDLINEPVSSGYTQPIQIYNDVTIIGTETNPIRIERTKTPIDLPDRSQIVGPQILGVKQKIQISEGAVIQDSLVGSTQSSQGYSISTEIRNGSNIRDSFIFGNTIIGGKAKIAFSQVGFNIVDGPVLPLAKKSFSGSLLQGDEYSSVLNINSAEVNSTTIASYGEISGAGTKLTKSNISGKVKITENSTVDDSNLIDCEIENSKVLAKSDLRGAKASGESTITNSRFEGGTLEAKAIVSDSLVLGGTINNSKVLNESVVSGDISNGSEINKSSATESTITTSTIKNRPARCS